MPLPAPSPAAVRLPGRLGRRRRRAAVQVQLVRHDHYVARAQRQQERTLALNPVRGSILDARGRVLAESIAAESIYADPQAITRHARGARKRSRPSAASA